jgi:NTP pyrophosphatase (non-canonical NTP hydrolase)
MDLNELRAANVTRCEEVFHPLDAWSPTDWACALGGEAGEALNAVKKLRRLADGNNTAKDPQTEAGAIRAIAEEIADTVIYADLLAARLSIDVSAAVREKFNAVSELRGSTVFLRDVHEDMTSQALRDVLIERRRQVYGEGYETAHDDQHAAGELAQAAACYILASQSIPVACGSSSLWPWSADSWKPGDRRHNLNRATALLLAELERMCRAEAVDTEVAHG